MKVRVSLTIDVDREAWLNIYGRGETAAEIREDVRSYVLEYVQGSAASDEGAIVGVKVG
jgi:hypothetical protein